MTLRGKVYDLKTKKSPIIRSFLIAYIKKEIKKEIKSYIKQSIKD